MNRILTLLAGAALLLAGAGCGTGSTTTTLATPDSATRVAARATVPHDRSHCVQAPKYGGCRVERPARSGQARPDRLCLVSATVIEARLAAGDPVPDCIRVKQAIRTSPQP